MKIIQIGDYYYVRKNVLCLPFMAEYLDRYPVNNILWRGRSSYFNDCRFSSEENALDAAKNYANVVQEIKDRKKVKVLQIINPSICERISQRVKKLVTKAA